MGLTKYKLGDLIQQRREKFTANEDIPIRGVSRDGFIPPKQEDADTSIYNVFYRNDFVFNPARMELNSIALNTEFEKAICSSLYEIFWVERTDIVLPEYLNLYIKRDEFARKCWFEAIGSARNYFRVSNLSEFEVDLPPIDIQQKYVDIYKSMIANQMNYERGLDDLKLVCDAFIENLRRNSSSIVLKQYLQQTRDKNELCLKLKNRSVSNSKTFIDAKESVVSGVDTQNYLIVKKGDFAYNTVTTRNADKLSIALNIDEDCLVSPLYTTFRVSNENLLPEYLCLWLHREQYDRFARYHSWGSARELFPFEILSETQIPIPELDIQKAISNINDVLLEREKICERLKTQIKDICPVLIRGALKEAKQL